MRPETWNIGRWILALCLCTAGTSLYGEEMATGFHGLLLGREVMPNGNPGLPVHELRALPGFGWQSGAGEGNAGEISLDLGVSIDMHAGDTQTSTHYAFHRLWLEHAQGTSWRLRAGRQEIRFGAARLLRSLHWFESLDPRDPASVAAGVDALVFALPLFDSKLTLTSWGILSSSPTDYVLPFATVADTLSPGGRIAYRLPGGGTGGLALHQRLIDRSKARAAFGVNDAPGHQLWEQRAGSDGVWPGAIELWYEASLVVWQQDSLLPRQMDFATMGAAHPMGEAWQLTAELMAAHIRGSLLTVEQTNHYAACALDFSPAASYRVSASGVFGVDVSAQLWAFDTWYRLEGMQLGAGWYDHELPTPLWGISGTMLDPPDLTGGRGVRLTLRLDY